jgi:signal transduction histidine kinase
VLYEFVTTYRQAIIDRSKEKLTARPWPPASSTELDNGVPLFLTQLAEVLRDEEAGRAYAPSDIESGGLRHGRDLLASGFSISQVVHDYGDICQAVTELAVEQHAPITTEEFHTLNRCLDTAIAEAVTEHARLTAHARYADDAERSGHTAHETRDLLNTAILAFETLKRGTVAINCSTGAVLGRSLLSLRDLVNSTLSEIRVAADQQRRERIRVASFLAHIAAAGHLHAEVRGLNFTSELLAEALAINADPELLASAVTNLLNNAFKFTRPGGTVFLRARREHERLLVEVEDECGGIPKDAGDLFQPFAPV